MVVPVDSELAALHQCLDGREPSQIRRLILTASGGPFWRTGPPPLASVRQALRHPTWQMGRKITVDSATLMNKGLEVIEAVRLFDVTPERVETIIHPQSIVHSMVEFTDGSVLAQLSEPDMRLPIQYALTWPNRLPSPVRPLTFAEVGRLEFRPTRPWLFPCLRLAYASLRAGPAGPCVLNAANEVAVSAFLAGRIAFGAIPAIIRTTLTRLGRKPFRGRDSIEWLLRLEAEAARLARSLISGSSSRKGH
jgi:1-deoxy-D-xylulose-5-phosphate reductoisomerase